MQKNKSETKADQAAIMVKKVENLLISSSSAFLHWEEITKWSSAIGPNSPKCNGKENMLDNGWLVYTFTFLAAI